MSQRIPQSFIDDLIARADIVELIGSRVTLAKAGREYKAVCPFHAEKTPSFTVSPEKGFYHCFGCGAHGTALGFLMQYDNLEFLDAVEALAELCGVEVPKADTAREREPTADLYALLQSAAKLYSQALRDSNRAIDYLKGRGIDGATAARFGIGYAPDAWDTVLKTLGADAQRVARLREAGLVIRNDQGRHYDRFRDRIMFPIGDPRGRVIGFGGRVIGAGEPKYLNSPETPVFHKGQALYGLYEARQAQGRPEHILVVEGYLDVASLVQHGVEPVVATLGTATTADHVRRLTRLAACVIFCFDGDRAGRAAAWRALETALPVAGGQAEIRFLLLPDGHDPDSLVRERGKAHFDTLIAGASPLSTFLVEELGRRVDLGSAEGQLRLAGLAQPLLQSVRDELFRAKLLERLAAAVGTSVDNLRSRFEAGSPTTVSRPVPASGPAPSEQAPKRSSLVQKALRLVLHYPAAAAQIGPIEDLQRVRQAGVPLLLQVLEAAAEDPQINTGGLVERFRDDPDGRYLGRLAAAPPIDAPDDIPQVLKGCAARIVEADRRERWSALVARGLRLSEEERAEEQRLRALLAGGDARPRAS